MPTKYRHYQILKHDFSLPLMKLSHCCVVACIDYPECDGDFQRLICFRDGRVLKPPSVKMEFSDNHEG